MIYFCLIGLLGSLLMLLGDQLLYLSKLSVKKEKTVDAMDYVAEVISGLPVKRFCTGGLIGPFAAFIYCVGFYHLVLAVNGELVVWKNVALAAFFFELFWDYLWRRISQSFSIFRIVRKKRTERKS